MLRTWSSFCYCTRTCMNIRCAFTIPSKNPPVKIPPVKIPPVKRQNPPSQNPPVKIPPINSDMPWHGFLSLRRNLRLIFCSPNHTSSIFCIHENIFWKFQLHSTDFKMIQISPWGGGGGGRGLMWLKHRYYKKYFQFRIFILGHENGMSWNVK